MAAAGPSTSRVAAAGPSTSRPGPSTSRGAKYKQVAAAGPSTVQDQIQAEWPEQGQVQAEGAAAGPSTSRVVKYKLQVQFAVQAEQASAGKKYSPI